VFEIAPSGALTTLHSFCTVQNCTDGANPETGLVQCSDGNLYGTTLNGTAGHPANGNTNSGVVFELSAPLETATSTPPPTPAATATSASESVLYSFCGQVTVIGEDNDCLHGDLARAD
jgi:hypothetical protein